MHFFKLKINRESYFSAFQGIWSKSGTELYKLSLYLLPNAFLLPRPKTALIEKSLKRNRKWGGK